MRGKKGPKQLDSDRAQGGLVADRNSVPDASGLVTEHVPTVEPPTTNRVDGLVDPDVEAQAPGRTTHGATNNP